MAEKNKAMLHQLIAVEADLEKTAKKVIEEAKTTFTKRQEHFTGLLKTYTPYNEGDPGLPEERRELVTTVGEKLGYIRSAVQKYIDLLIQKERTNQDARADLIVNGSVVAEQLPATFLLGMETRLRWIRDMIEAAPTLAPGVEWVRDEKEKEGVFKMEHPKVTQRTKKLPQHKVVVAATDKHPAQVEAWTEDVPIGEFELRVKSGELTPLEKSKLLERCDTLIRACKKARQKANSTEVVDMKIGNTLMNFILKGTV